MFGGGSPTTAADDVITGAEANADGTAGVVADEEEEEMPMDEVDEGDGMEVDDCCGEVGGGGARRLPSFPLRAGTPTAAGSGDGVVSKEAREEEKKQQQERSGGRNRSKRNRRRSKRKRRRRREEERGGRRRREEEREREQARATERQKRRRKGRKQATVSR